MKVGPGCVFAVHMCTSHYMLWGLPLLPWELRGSPPLKGDLSMLVKVQAASPPFTQTEDSKHMQTARMSSFSPLVTSLFALCLVLWTSTCLCLVALNKRASTHILRAVYSATPLVLTVLTQPPMGALQALCLRSWPASWTVNLDLIVSSRHWFFSDY